MSMMSCVMPGNIERVRALFPPFPVELNDRYMTIRTFNEDDPPIHCLNALTDRLYLDIPRPHGLYVYAVDRRSNGTTQQWYHKLTYSDEADELVNCLNVKNVFKYDAMRDFGFIRPA